MCRDENISCKHSSKGNWSGHVNMRQNGSQDEEYDWGQVGTLHNEK